MRVRRLFLLAREPFRCASISLSAALIAIAFARARLRRARADVRRLGARTPARRGTRTRCSTDKLVESGWVTNDKGRGFKVMQVYRSDCGDKPTAEMRIALKDGKAVCVYGGAPETAKLDSGADYVMKAETAAGSRWARANMAR